MGRIFSFFIPIIRHLCCFYVLLNIAMKLNVKIINKSSFDNPRHETSGSAGLDIRANIESAIELPPLGRELIPTGLFIEIPSGYECQIRPRSGLSIKKGLTVINAPGTIDSDYRGEIKVPIINLSSTSQLIEPGERIAQMVFAAYSTVQWETTEELSQSDRGSAGFGSTGKA